METPLESHYVMKLNPLVNIKMIGVFVCLIKLALTVKVEIDYSFDLVVM